MAAYQIYWTRTMQYVATSAKEIAFGSAKGVAALGLLLISPVVLLFAGPLAIGISSDILHEIGGAPASLGLSGAVALVALYKLQHPD